MSEEIKPSQQFIRSESGDVLLVRCYACQEYKAPSDMGSNGQDKLRSQICRICKNALSKRSATGERRRRYYIKCEYGFSPEQYDDMLEKQGGVCAICKSPPKKKYLLIDHDHERLNVRGLLCSYCNVRLEWALLYGARARDYVRAFYERFGATPPEDML